MKCEIIKDLLPAYCDSVCSAETAAAVEEHVKDCSSCRSMLENCFGKLETDVQEPQKPFRKIKGRIFRSKAAIGVLVLLIAAILTAIGYLTYNQINHVNKAPSFDTIISSIGARSVIDDLCKGDINSVMDKVEINHTGSLIYDYDKVYVHCRSVLTDFYEKYFKGRSLQAKVVDTGYGTVFGEQGESVFINVDVSENGKYMISFLLASRTGGKFLMCTAGAGIDKTAYPNCQEDINALDLALNPEPRPTAESVIINDISGSADGFVFLIKRFGGTADERSALENNVIELSKYLKCENAFYTHFRFDDDNSRFLLDLGFIFAEKETGKRAVYCQTVKLRTAFYDFEVLPEFEPVIIDGGISGETLEKLEGLLIF